MRNQIAGAAGLAILIATAPAMAAEGGFSTYGLGGASFGAGITPPPGVYLSTVGVHLEGKTDFGLTIGGVPLDFGLNYEIFSVAANGLWVPETKVLGGNLGVSVTVPYAWLDMTAQLTGPGGGSLSGTVEGAGIADVAGRLQLGWQEGTFFHSVYVQGLAPTGRYELGFKPNIGLNRPAIDVGWGFTWIEPSSTWQVNGTAGYTFRTENDLTDYTSGDEFHVEWAIGRDFAKGLTLGVSGYSYRQLSGDSGPGAVLGPLKGSVDAVGPAMSYSTTLGATPLTISARYYKEFNVDKRWDTNATFLSATMKF